MRAWQLMVDLNLVKRSMVDTTKSQQKSGVKIGSSTPKVMEMYANGVRKNHKFQLVRKVIGLF